MMNPNTSSVAKQKKILGNLCLEGYCYVTLCVQFTFQNMPKMFCKYNYTAKNMISTIFVIFAKSTLGTINNSHFHEDYVCG